MLDNSMMGSWGNLSMSVCLFVYCILNMSVSGQPADDIFTSTCIRRPSEKDLLQRYDNLQKRPKETPNNRLTYIIICVQR